MLRARWNPSSGFRRGLLRLFGARIGPGVVIKPGVRVKYPWLLEIGDHSWIGEDAWIDNLTTVAVGAHVCISQGAYLCTGNHDWSDPAFGLIVGAITLHAGSWVGAQCIICPNTILETGAIVTAGSVATGVLEQMGIYAGNPAIKVKTRVMQPRLNK